MRNGGGVRATRVIVAARRSFLTRSECAEHLGIKPRQLDNLVTEGLPRERGPGRQWRYDATAAKAWYDAKMRDKRPDPKSNGRRDAEGELAAVKLRLARLDLAEREGELVDVEFVLQRERLLVERFRSKLNPLPGKIAGRLLGVRDYADALQRIKPLWDDLLTSLAATGHELEHDYNRNGNGNAEHGASASS